MALLAMEEAAANNRVTVAAGDRAYVARVLYNSELKSPVCNNMCTLSECENTDSICQHVFGNEKDYNYQTCMSCDEGGSLFSINSHRNIKCSEFTINKYFKRRLNKKKKLHEFISVQLLTHSKRAIKDKALVISDHR